METEKKTENRKRLQIRIEQEAAGMKLEHYLRQKLQFTKAQIKSMKFRENGLVIDGVRVRISHMLQAGENLEILLEDEGRTSEHLKETAEPIEILYEDEDLIAVWKEAGLVVHPAHGHYADTLSNRVHSYFTGKNMQVMIRSIGRLDRDTSGIVVFAKNQVAAARLWEQKEDGRFWKEYLAICSGVMEPQEEKETQEEKQAVQQKESQKEMQLVQRIQAADLQDAKWHTITASIGKLPGDLMRMCVTGDGKPAVTHYQVLHQWEDRMLVRVRIETGRTHQIRVHMQSIGHPLVGDILYGGEAKYVSGDLCGGGADDFWKTDNTGRADSVMFLCAWRAELIQPFTGKTLFITPENLDTKMDEAVSCFVKEMVHNHNK